MVTSGDTSRATLSATSAPIAAGSDSGIFDVNTVPNNAIDGDAVITVEVSAAGFESATASFIVLDDDTPFPTLVVNEYLANGDGGSGAEYVELFNGGAAAVDLSGYTVEVYQANSNFGAGTLANSIPIASGSIPSNGFFTIGNQFVDAVYGATPDQVVTDLDLNRFDVSIVLVDDSDEVVFTALYFDSANETTVAANRAGDLIPADVSFSDAGGFMRSGFYLTTDGGPEAGSLEFVDTATVAPSATPTLSNLTPSLFLSSEASSVTEDASGLQVTVTRFPDTVGDLVVTLSSSDTGELTVPASVTIFSGDVSAEFTAVPVPDGIQDGAQPVTVTATSGALSTDTEITVNDADAPALNVCDIVLISLVADRSRLLRFCRFGRSPRWSADQLH